MFFNQRGGGGDTKNLCKLKTVRVEDMFVRHGFVEMAVSQGGLVHLFVVVVGMDPDVAEVRGAHHLRDGFVHLLHERGDHGLLHQQIVLDVIDGARWRQRSALRLLMKLMG